MRRELKFLEHLLLVPFHMRNEITFLDKAQFPNQKSVKKFSDQEAFSYKKSVQIFRSFNISTIFIRAGSLMNAKVEKIIFAFR